LKPSKPLPWEQEVDRFFAGIAKFDAIGGVRTAHRCSPEKLLQDQLRRNDPRRATGNVAPCGRQSDDWGELLPSDIQVGQLSKSLKHQSLRSNEPQ